MENRQYLSVMTVAASSGDLELTLTTYDAPTNLTIVANITGISSSDDEDTIARAILDQGKIIISQYGATYNGYPDYLVDGPAATFRVTRTDHCLCFYSESQFTLEITNNEIGSILLIESIPALMTNQEAEDMAALIVLDLTDSGGSTLTATQLANFILLASSEFVTYTKNPIVASTYVFENWGNWQESVKLDMIPLISVDPPYTRRPNLFSFFISMSDYPDNRNVYDFNSKTGWVAYRFAQEVFEAYEPFDDNNEWKISYVAGHKSIPLIVKKAIIQLMGVLGDIGDADVKDLRGGTFQVGLMDIKDKLKLIFMPIKSLIL